MRTLLLSSVILVSVAAPARAQSQPPPGPSRLSFGALAGVTFGTTGRAGFGGQFGAEVAPGLVWVAEGGRLVNTVPGEINDQMETAEALIAAKTGLPVSLSMTMPGTYVWSGLRAAGRGRRVAPFFEGGAGICKLTPKIRASIGGEDFGEEIDQLLENADLNTTRFMLVIGGGVTSQVTRAVAVDVGYRYLRIFTDDPAINVSKIYAAVRFLFN